MTAVVSVIYAGWMYYRRAAALQLQLDGPFDDKFGPLMLVGAITASLFVSVALYFVWGGQ